jgi:hypothetical protein
LVIVFALGIVTEILFVRHEQKDCSESPTEFRLCVAAEEGTPKTFLQPSYKYEQTLVNIYYICAS